MVTDEREMQRRALIARIARRQAEGAPVEELRAMFDMKQAIGRRLAEERRGRVFQSNPFRRPV